MCKRDSTVENDYDFSTIVHNDASYILLENSELKHG